MNLKLQGKTAVVTGGTKGIGFAIARMFLTEGCSVIVCGRSREILEEALEELKLLGRADGIVADVTKQEAAEQLANFAVQTTGRLDIWINNVGGAFPKEGEDYSEEQIDCITRLCFHSTVYGCQAAFRYMKQEGGAIVNISSLAARCGTVGASTLYGPLKAAVVQLAAMYAGEYAAYGIRVNAVLPGFTVTPMVQKSIAPDYLKSNAEATLLRRAAEPEEIAGPVVFLASGMASYITGTSLEVSGGRSIVLNPSYSYEQRAKTVGGVEA